MSASRPHSHQAAKTEQSAELGGVTSGVAVPKPSRKAAHLMETILALSLGFGGALGLPLVLGAFLVRISLLGLGSTMTALALWGVPTCRYGP